VQEELKALPLDNELLQELVAIHRRRWDYAFTAVQGAGHLLDPEFWESSIYADEEVKGAFYTMVEKTFPLPFPVDVTAYPNPAAALAATEEYDAQVESQTNKRGLAERQLTAYQGKKGVFGRQSCMANASKQVACEWWSVYGTAVPELQEVAMRVLGQPAGAGAAERGHKEMNFIKSKSRNRLGSEKLNDLIYIRHNLGMLEKVTLPKALTVSFMYCCINCVRVLTLTSCIFSCVINANAAQVQDVAYTTSLAIKWTEGVEANVAWVDAWQEPRSEEDSAVRAPSAKGTAPRARSAGRAAWTAAARAAAAAAADVGGSAVGGPASGSRARGRSRAKVAPMRIARRPPAAARREDDFEDESADDGEGEEEEEEQREEAEHQDDPASASEADDDDQPLRSFVAPGPAPMEVTRSGRQVRRVTLNVDDFDTE
jgi:hypothetical protein